METGSASARDFTGFYCVTGQSRGSHSRRKSSVQAGMLQEEEEGEEERGSGVRALRGDVQKTVRMIFGSRLREQLLHCSTSSDIFAHRGAWIDEAAHEAELQSCRTESSHSFKEARTCGGEAAAETPVTPQS
ncbi:unnamed protein product [Pleuronectes platessa]|uniref:Uncharacterized protein n=1 Tax=Pleuronectes platessa TaxID=8262 RepID=A0A9N7U5L9_PLEPL|nr:unnamed protein product [Pleuronectes platessa]